METCKKVSITELMAHGGNIPLPLPIRLNDDHVKQVIKDMASHQLGGCKPMGGRRPDAGYIYINVDWGSTPCVTVICACCGQSTIIENAGTE